MDVAHAIIFSFIYFSARFLDFIVFSYNFATGYFTLLRLYIKLCSLFSNLNLTYNAKFMGNCAAIFSKG